MPAVMVKERPGVELPAIRKFDTADLSKHGGWICKRLAKALSIPEAQVASWVANVLPSREYLFLYQDHAVALAQVCYGEKLSPRPVIRERFVFALDGHAAEAALFYVEFRNWAKSLDAEVIIVEEMSDVPHDAIKDVLGGRLFTKPQVFARV